MKTAIICITPVKNEVWMIRRFLECASIWADVIILADQNSEDDTVAIASEFPKVRLINNPSETFNEPERQRLLFEEARKIKGKKLLIALDADECLSANFMKSSEWNKLLQAEPGTCISFDLVNIAPNSNQYWSSPHFIRGFGDDSNVSFAPDKPIHTEKVPFQPNSPVIHCHEIKILHYQYTDWDRTRSKHNWYQTWERINFPKKHPLDIYRLYHHMYAIPKSDLKPLKTEWFKGYTNAGIDMFHVNKEDSYYWDDIVIQLLKKHGAEYFSNIDIWWREWEGFQDPRTIVEKTFFWYLKASQPHHHRLPIRLVDRLLRKIL